MSPTILRSRSCGTRVGGAFAIAYSEVVRRESYHPACGAKAKGAALSVAGG
jgi:hypothetical protein